MAERPMEHFTVDGVNIFEVTDAKARQDVSNLKDDFHSYHSELGSGYADQLVSGIQNEDSVPYNFRKVPYDATLEQVEGIVGVDVVLNQLVQNGNFESGISGWQTNSGTMTTSNGVLTFVRGSGTGSNQVFQFINTVTNHVLFGCAMVQLVTSTSRTIMMRIGSIEGSRNTVVSPNTWTMITTIKKSNVDSPEFNIYGKLSTEWSEGDTVNIKECMCFDLTATFGTQIADYVYSLETATAGAGVAWLKANFPKIFDAGYIAYNAGTMVHVSGLSAKKTVGFNQWDEQWEVGLISVSNGQNINGQGIRSKNMCECFPNTQYHVKFNSGGSKYIFWYDVDGNFIYQNPVVTEQTFTSPDNARYFKIRVDTIINYNHDICINLSSSKNGTYEPYEAHEYPLDSTIDLHGILKLDSQNNLYADGDVYLSDGTVNRRYILVNLGTQNWGSGTVGNVSFFTTDLGILKHVEYGQYANAICSKYVTSKTESGGITAETFADKSFIVWTNGAIYVKDSAYSDVASFKAGLSGVYLVAELATPTTETAEPYNPNQICDPNGTEEFISDTVAPVGHVTKYPDNLRKKLDDLPWNFATLIAPTESTYKATRNYTTGSLFIVNNVLYKATANIANGGTITPNTNCTATTLAEVISALS